MAEAARVHGRYDPLKTGVDRERPWCVDEHRPALESHEHDGAVSRVRVGKPEPQIARLAGIDREQSGIDQRRAVFRDATHQYMERVDKTVDRLGKNPSEDRVRANAILQDGRIRDEAREALV